MDIVQQGSFSQLKKNQKKHNNNKKTVTISVVLASIRLSWGSASLLKAPIRSKLMGLCSSELIINPLHTAERCCGAGPNNNWLSFNFCPPAARKTNQANAWSRGASQGYPSVLLSWCQGLAPCLWIQQVNLLVLLFSECWWSASGAAAGLLMPN